MPAGNAKLQAILEQVAARAGVRTATPTDIRAVIDQANAEITGMMVRGQRNAFEAGIAHEDVKWTEQEGGEGADPSIFRDREQMAWEKSCRELGLA